ncbi:MAG: glycosyltransferase, partial [Bacteroidales bacterium]|nr:glycosyltransferase [Bacteroidales bacterium]
MKKEQIEYSVVVPVYNSEKTLEILFQRLSEVFQKTGNTFEVVFVNDNSKDNSYNILSALHDRHHNILVIDLFKNSGQQNALMCGFKYCNGKYVVTIDD